MARNPKDLKFKLFVGWRMRWKIQYYIHIIDAGGRRFNVKYVINTAQRLISLQEAFNSLIRER
jgi:hypothetical protein